MGSAHQLWGILAKVLSLHLGMRNNQATPECITFFMTPVLASKNIDDSRD